MHLFRLNAHQNVMDFSRLLISKDVKRAMHPVCCPPTTDRISIFMDAANERREKFNKYCNQTESIERPKATCNGMNMVNP